MNKISILGCGWLGFPLAQKLIENGFSVKGSTTSENKISTLENSGIEPFLISLEAEKIQGNINDFLENSEILIIDIPPKLRGLEKESFVEKIQTLLPFIEKSLIKKVLFISSTSVFADDNLIVTKDTIPNPDTESGKQLVITENLLRKNTSFKTTILRFSGLIGQDRHPIKFLAGRKNIDNPKGPINLIHQDDCIAIILKIIKYNSWNTTYNACAPFHPSREDYYTQKAIEMNLPLPEFNHNIPFVGKIILSDKLEKELEYNFLHKY